jgi:adenosylhomocysteine nucleosidase
MTHAPDRPHRIGILSAMPQELQAVLDLMPDEHMERCAGREFWPGHLAGHDVVAAVSGIGKVAAATTATLLLERYQVSAIVFTGVAGGLGKGVAVGDVVVASELLQHDMDASPLVPRHEVPGYGRARFATDTAWRAALHHAAQRTLAQATQVLGPQAVADFGLQHARVHEGLVVSGDRFVATTAESATLRHTLPDALAVEMEGAAVAQVCHDFCVPFALVRTVSDRADDAAHVDFVRFVTEVASAFSAHIVHEALLHATQHQRQVID